MSFLQTNHPEPSKQLDKFKLVASLVRDWEMSGGDAPEPLRALVMGRSMQAPSLLPRIQFDQETVYCNHASLDLGRRPTTMRLFRAFCSSPRLECTREELMRQVYRVKRPERCSERYLQTVYVKTIKLISRSRILATTMLSYAVSYGVEWFVYDQERKTWCLYRLRNEYVNQKLGTGPTLDS
jgi:hypothetical protein